MSNRIEPLRIVRMPEILKRVGVSQPTIYRWQLAKKFPPMVKLGDASVGVSSLALDAWLAARIDDANANAKA